MENNEYSKMQRVKRHMFAMRNGIIADTLRKAGSPFVMIFGMNLPQIAEMAQEFGPDMELAKELWHDRRTRESMLLAPMLMPIELVDEEMSRQMISEINCTEVADVLCLKLLRRLPFALDLAKNELETSQDGIRRYTAVRLLWNLVGQFPTEILSLARAESTAGFPSTADLAASLADEASFILSEA